MYYILLFFLCFFFTLGLTPLLIKYLKKAQVVDLPGGRHIHKTVIPRMGGLLIYLASSFVLIYFSQDLYSSRFLILSSLLIFLIGLLDDTLGLSYHIKFLFQLIVAFLVVLTLSTQYQYLAFIGVTIPAPLDVFILILFITAAINSINFFDGIDGLVSKSSILWFSTVLILSTIYSDQFLTLLSTCMLGSILGFLHYNSYPARVFLGDTGSLSIGFYLVVSSLILSGKTSSGNVLDMTFAVILMLVPLTDASRVIIKRMSEKRSPFLPDKTHIHHILLELFSSQRAAVSILEVITASSCVLAIVYASGKHTYAAILSFCFALMILLIKPLLYYLKTYLLKYIRLYIIQRFIFGIISSTAVFFIIYIFSIQTALDHNLSIVLMFLGIITFGIAYTSMKKNQHVYGVFILLNIIISLIITNPDHTFSVLNSVFSIFSNIFSINDFFVMAFLIIVLSINMDISISLHLNEAWIDTISIMLLAIIIAAGYFIPHLSSSNFIILLLGCMTILVWIRRTTSYYNKIAKRMSYYSFGLPFGILLKLLIS